MKTEMIITMAGLGSRFRKAGYGGPKYRALAKGKPLFDWSMLSLNAFIENGSPFVFIVQEADEAPDFIHARARALGIVHSEIIEINGQTDGQATTALLAKDAVRDRAAPMAVYNIDTHVAPNALSPDDVRGDGWIPCFDAPGESWSFAKADADLKVSEVREKQRISNHATIGLYYFSSFDLYQRTYETYYAPGAVLDAGERYIAPMYNQLIADDRPVYVHTVPFDAVVALGTPDDVKAFDPSASPRQMA